MIPPSIPPEQPASAEYPAEYARVARSIKVERLASIPPERLASLVLLNGPPGAQLGLHFMLVPCFECTLRLRKGDAFVLLWAVNKQLRLTPRRVSFWKGLGFC